MLKLLERNIASIERRLVLLAPPQATLPGTLNNVIVDPVRHAQLVREMQSLRGSIYLDEGNVTQQQLSDGLHQTPEDKKSWHILMTDAFGKVTSCAWYLDLANTTSVQNLRVRNCPLAKLEEWRDRLLGAVESEIARARRDGLRYAELGGWAIAKERRCTPEGVMMAFSTYALSQLLGNALGITTANVVHSCSSILRRLGGAHLEYEGTPIPAYFDPKYNTEIELLRFDSRQPSRHYAGLIDSVRKTLGHVTVIASPLDMAAQVPYHAVAQMSQMQQPLFAA
jgi:hypothetical protein